LREFGFVLRARLVGSYLLGNSLPAKTSRQ